MPPLIQKSFSDFKSLNNLIFENIQPNKKTHMLICIENELQDGDDNVMIGMPSPEIIPREKTLRVK